MLYNFLLNRLQSADLERRNNSSVQNSMLIYSALFCECLIVMGHSNTKKVPVPLIFEL